ncbi:hypothetical protein [Pseudoxanthomonas winnipegensis]
MSPILALERKIRTLIAVSLGERLDGLERASEQSPLSNPTPLRDSA